MEPSTELLQRTEGVGRRTIKQLEGVDDPVFKAEADHECGESWHSLHVNDGLRCERGDGSWQHLRQNRQRCTAATLYAETR